MGVLYYQRDIHYIYIKSSNREMSSLSLRSDACPSECVNLWKKEQGEHPVCMTLLEGQLKER